jgi:prepilin-type N-terminal cleavage/methylation domain-containing protein
MKQKGFTVIEMLVAIVVICVIVLIALPMHGVRTKKVERVNAQAQLMVIKESEDRYRMETGGYTMDTTKLANWKNHTKKYCFQIEYADTSRFVAQANGDLNNDKIYDDEILRIDQSGTLTKVK